MCTRRLRSKYIEFGDIGAQSHVPLVAFLDLVPVNPCNYQIRLSLGEWCTGTSKVWVVYGQWLPV